MGHNINYRTCDEKADKAKIEKSINEFVSHETWQEGGGGLNSPIRWLSVICESYEEAETYIKNNDRNWYDSLAVRFKECTEFKPSKKLEALLERMNAERQKYNELESNIHYANVQSEFIGCKECGSRLARKYIKSNTCPLCHNDLRPQSTLDRIATLYKNWQKVAKEYDELQKAETKKAKEKNCKIKWLIKYEYHT